MDVIFIVAFIAELMDIFNILVFAAGLIAQHPDVNQAVAMLLQCVKRVWKTKHNLSANA